MRMRSQPPDGEPEAEQPHRRQVAGQTIYVDGGFSATWPIPFPPTQTSPRGRGTAARVQ